MDKTDNIYNILKELVKYRCVSGRENGISRAIQKMTAPYADSVSSDALGNLIVFKKGAAENAKRLMLCAHMDEIGFMTTSVSEDGYIKFAPIGGINYTAAAFCEVVFENGTRGVMAPEVDRKAKKGEKSELGFDNCYVDIGAKNRREAEKKVSVGDCFAVKPSLCRLSSGRVSGRPVDDRIGCAVLIKALEQAERFENDTYFVFSVQEELGLRGSKTAAYGIMPDYGVAVDVCASFDTPGKKDGPSRLGGGACIKIKDASVMCDGDFVRLLQRTADENGIPWQPEILTRGGTDAASMQTAGAGCRAGGISVPTRYTHTPSETFDIKDAEAACRLVSALVGTRL